MPSAASSPTASDMFAALAEQTRSLDPAAVTAAGATCAPLSERIEFLLNGMMHVIILLAIIGTFFFVYVSHLTSGEYRSQIKGLIDQAMPQVFKSIEGAERKVPAIRAYIDAVDVQGLANYYKTTPTLALTIQNDWLKTVYILVIVGLFVAMVIISVVLAFTCQTCVWASIRHLLIENAAIFACVGTIEVCFFLFIATKYVPVKPSVIMQTLIRELQKASGAAPAPAVGVTHGEACPK